MEGAKKLSYTGNLFLGKEGKIIVQTLSTRKVIDGKICDGESEGGKDECVFMDFNLVDLKKDSIELNYTPSLIKLSSPYSILASDKFIYLFEGDDEDPSEDDRLKHQRLLSLHHDPPFDIFTGAAFIDFSLQPLAWRPLPTPSDGYFTILCDNIFQFSSLPPLLLDRKVGLFNPFGCVPPDLVDCRVSRNVIPDPSSTRFLVHLHGGQLPSPTLYAFNVDVLNSAAGTWEPLIPNFEYWSDIATIVGDVIYFYCRAIYLLRAYDLAKKAWLEVVWVQDFGNDPDLRRYAKRFYSLFSLGNNVMCFAGCAIVCRPDTKFMPQVFFPMFRVERSDETLILSALSTPRYDLPNAGTVSRFFHI